MPDLTFTAAKSRAQGRPGWTISFRHPLRPDTKGRPGLKMRRGLGTTDIAEADRLVAEMNVILSDSSWWNGTKRVEAERTFSSIVVAAFFDEIQAGIPDPWAVREGLIPLPGAEDGYTRAMLVGTTGAGKTSLLRHLIGSDPDEDRFPSTSTARTTISDIEVVQAETNFSAVVTFFSEFWVQANVEECVADACSAVWEKADAGRVAERLLNHRDQRFRLSYILGSWSGDTDPGNDDDWSFGGVETDTLDEVGLNSAERDSNSATLHRYIDRIRSLSSRVVQVTSSELGEDLSRLSGLDRDAAQELFEERIQAEDGFDEIVQDLIDDVRRRFDMLDGGTLSRHQSGWPSTWTFESGDRKAFIEQIRWFSSNYAPQFGRLLTPVVNGIRVRGPFFPTFVERQPKLVLMDGQGLGHTLDSFTSVTTSVTKRFADVDVILLVDSAQQPMLAAPLSVVRAVAAGGHQHKLALAFTHFDHVKGVNLPSFTAKRAHVMASVTNGLTSLRDVLGIAIIRAIERTVDERCFMLGALDQPSKRLPKGVVVEFEKVLDFFAHAIEPSPEPEARPIYNSDGLVLAVQGATQAFRRPWTARLGLGSHESVHKEHWTRIKALNRRIAGGFDNNEYQHLKPVADLVGRLSEEVSRFLDNPSAWEPRRPNEEEEEVALSQIRQHVYAAIHDLAEHRVVEAYLNEWRAIFDLSGKGSTSSRAHGINGIFERGAPSISTVLTRHASDFVREMRTLVQSAIIDGGGKLEAQMSSNSAEAASESRAGTPVNSNVVAFPSR